MIARRHVTEIPDVLAPRKILRILRSADDEARGGEPARGLEKETLERILAVFRIRAEIRKTAAIALCRSDRTVRRRIDASVERKHAPRAELLQFVERRSSGVAEHQVERLQ